MYKVLNLVDSLKNHPIETLKNEPFLSIYQFALNAGITFAGRKCLPISPLQATLFHLANVVSKVIWKKTINIQNNSIFPFKSNYLVKFARIFNTLFPYTIIIIPVLTKILSPTQTLVSLSLSSIAAVVVNQTKCMIENKPLKICQACRQVISYH